MSDINRYRDIEHRREYLRIYMKGWRIRNHAKWRENEKRKNIERRQRVLEYYSKGTLCCSNCGYNKDVRALDIDHIDNNGSIERKNRTWANIYVFIENNKYPEGFQVLCKNCNWIKYLEYKTINQESPVIIEQPA